MSQECSNQMMEGKPVKIFSTFTLIFPCKQENIAFVKRIRVLFLEKPKPLMGWTWSSLAQFPSSGMPEDHKHLHTKRQVAAIPYCSCMWRIFLSANSPTSRSVSSQKTDTVRNLYSNILLPKTYSTLNSLWPISLLTFPGEKPIAEKSNKAKIVTHEKILVLLVKVKKQAWSHQSSTSWPPLHFYLSPMRESMKEQHG